MKNLSNPLGPEASALRRLATSADGETIKRYLRAELVSTDRDNRLISDHVDLHRSQGKAITLQAILDLLEAKPL